MNDMLYTLSIWALPILLAVTFHEASHGFVAWRLGDSTAYQLGRVTFNPIKHIDLFGTIILPLLLFLSPLPFVLGYAKPVPVNFRKLRRPRRDMMLVAFAGPGANLVLAIASALLIHIALRVPGETGSWLVANLANSLLINVVLAVFNMLPIPPLDGGRIAVGLLPRPLAWRLARLERFGLFIVIALLFLVPWIARKLGLDFNIVATVIGKPVMIIIDLVATLTGLGKL
ncbi:MAG: site-2 protease family protein [Alphaproteobacteria bacterium]